MKKRPVGHLRPQTAKGSPADVRAMTKLTFLEGQLPGSTLAANAPFTTGEGTPAAESVPEPGSDAERGGRRGVGAVIGLVFLLAVALAVRKWFAEDEEIDLS